MADDIVRVEVVRGQTPGLYVPSWSEVTVERGLDQAAASFSLTVGRGLEERQAGAYTIPVREGDLVRVLVGQDLVVTGWVDRANVERSADDHRITIVGRSLTGDLVDCSAVHSPGQWRGATLLAIARDLAKPFGVPVRGGPEAEAVVDVFEIEQGETVFDAIERLARLKGLLVRDAPDGALVLARPALRRAAAALVHMDGPDGNPHRDNNVLESRVSYATDKRFSEIIVKGQTDGGKRSAVGAKAVAKDLGVGRYRPLILTAEGKSGAAGCTDRARWEVARRRGKGRQLTHTVRGWRQVADGPLWDCDLVAPVQDSTAQVFEDLLVCTIRYRLSSRGRLTELVLEPPEAWTPQPVVPKDGAGGAKWANVAGQVKGASS